MSINWLFKTYLTLKIEYNVNPFKLVYFNPQAIDYATAYTEYTDGHRNTFKSAAHFDKIDRGYFSLNYFGRILDGDWDIETVPVNEMQEFLSLKNFLNKNCDWRDTEFAQRCLEAIKQGSSINGHSNTETYTQNREKEVINLVQSMKIRGVIPTALFPWQEGYYNNVQVNIRRDGKILFQGGFHRFCIAKLLGITVMPVIVFVRHKLYMDSVNVSGRL